MRNAFVRSLIARAAEDDRVVLLTGDLGYKLFDEFAERFPRRFFNAGVAEANMVGMAAGLALEGKRPFVYSIVPFVTLRAYEHIRNDICYHHAPVTIVGVGGGYSYGANGPTHHSLEDIAVMRQLPNLAVVCPGDPYETEAAVWALATHEAPAYLRLGRAGEPNVHDSPLRFAVGESLPIREGNDVALFSTGNMLRTAVETADLLAEERIGCGVVSMPTVKPLDTAPLGAALRRVRLLATLEEHYRTGGFGGAVAEYVAEVSSSTLFHRFGAPEIFASHCGDQEYFRERHGLTARHLANAIRALLGGVG